MKQYPALPRVAAVAAWALLASTAATAQRPGAATPPGCAASASATETAAMHEGLVQRHGALVAYDRNLDGRFDEAERAELAAAIRQGRLRPEGLPTRPAALGNPPAEAVAKRMAAHYERLSAYDRNRDGHLDVAERERLMVDVQSGKAPPCGQPG